MCLCVDVCVPCSGGGGSSGAGSAASPPSPLVHRFLVSSPVCARAVAVVVAPLEAAFPDPGDPRAGMCMPAYACMCTCRCVYLCVRHVHVPACVCA